MDYKKFVKQEGLICCAMHSTKSTRPAHVAQAQKYGTNQSQTLMGLIE